jgi:hypothetical protein
MIYLLDSSLDEHSHSRYVIDIIKEHSDVEVKLIPLSTDMTIGELSETVNNLIPIVIPTDIVLCPWAIPGNSNLDNLFEELSSLCYVVAAAGNFHKPIDSFTPARTVGVIAVGTLNKSGLVAALSNYSNNKEMIWIPGTNYSVGWKNSSGTSVSAALYAAFLSMSLKHDDPNLLTKLIENHKNFVFNELNGTSQA